MIKIENYEILLVNIILFLLCNQSKSGYGSIFFIETKIKIMFIMKLILFSGQRSWVS